MAQCADRHGEHPVANNFQYYDRDGLGVCKMNQFNKFEFYHVCTILLALTFVCIKSYEYHDKFTHYEFTLNDGKFADGHMHENHLKREGTGWTGYAVIMGHVVDDEKELYDLKHAAKHPATHSELRIEGPQVKKMSSYG